MKLNIFRIQVDKVDSLKEKLVAVKMENIHSAEVDGWQTSFYFSATPDPVEIPWVKTYESIFTNPDKPTNKIHYGAYIYGKRTEFVTD